MPPAQQAPGSAGNVLPLPERQVWGLGRGRGAASQARGALSPREPLSCSWLLSSTLFLPCCTLRGSPSVVCAATFISQYSCLTPNIWVFLAEGGAALGSVLLRELRTGSQICPHRHSRSFPQFVFLSVNRINHS